MKIITDTTTYFIVNTSLNDLPSNSCKLSIQVSAFNAYGEGQKSTAIVVDSKNNMINFQ